jgi:hypothetical protein
LQKIKKGRIRESSIGWRRKRTDYLKKIIRESAVYEKKRKEYSKERIRESAG